MKPSLILTFLLILSVSSKQVYGHPRDLYKNLFRLDKSVSDFLYMTSSREYVADL